MCLAQLGFASKIHSFATTQRRCREAITLAERHGWGAEPIVVQEVLDGTAPVIGYVTVVEAHLLADPAVAHQGIRAELHRYFGLPFYRAMFAQAGYEADIAAYDAAAGVSARRAAISDAFIEDLCAIGKPEDVAAGVARYRAAGATNPMITNITGTDLRPTLHAAVAA